MLLVLGRGDAAEATAEDFFAAYARGDYDDAAALTDGDREQVAEVLEANVAGLDGASLEARVKSVTEGDDEARARVAMRWRVPEFGGFEYDNDRVRLTKLDDEWLVEWRNTVVHPELDAQGLRLGTVAEASERAPILDRDGEALVEPRPVVEIGVVPKELEDRGSAVEAIAENTGADAEALEDSIEAAEAPTNFVPAITLRQDEFAKVSAELEDDRGGRVRPARAPARADEGVRPGAPRRRRARDRRAAREEGEARGGRRDRPVGAGGRVRAAARR